MAKARVVKFRVAKFYLQVEDMMC